MPFDQERLRQRIAGALEKIYTEADPKLLNQYRAVIKKEVSLFKRSYLTAYLLMEQDQGGRRSRAPAENSKNEAPRRPLPEEDSARLFVGAGRSRRIFPREILALIAEKTSAAKDDIGIIRILDNYSFIQVRKSVADEIINALNGSSFRGRPLAVNYARARKDESPERPERDRDHGRGRGRERRPREDDSTRSPEREPGRNRKTGRDRGPDRTLDEGENAGPAAFDRDGGPETGRRGRTRDDEFDRERGLDDDGLDRSLDGDRGFNHDRSLDDDGFDRDLDNNDDLDRGLDDDDLDQDRSLGDKDDLDDETGDDRDLEREDGLENRRREDERDEDGGEDPEYSGGLSQEEDDHADEEGVKTDPGQ
jgi:hypothetical protein